MAGLRKGTGKPRRGDRRDEYWRGRVAAARTALEQFATMVDLLRSAAVRSDDPAAVLNEGSRALAEIAGRHR